ASLSFFSRAATSLSSAALVSFSSPAAPTQLMPIPSAAANARKRASLIVCLSCLQGGRNRQGGKSCSRPTRSSWAVLQDFYLKAEHAVCKGLASILSSPSSYRCPSACPANRLRKLPGGVCTTQQLTQPVRRSGAWAQAQARVLRAILTVRPS